MLPYTVIKEANPPNVSGTATGVVNFLNFTFSALLGPVFAELLRGQRRAADELEHYQTAFEPLLTASGSRSCSRFFSETGDRARWRGGQGGDGKHPEPASTNSC
jgi:hypothetical protein